MARRTVYHLCSRQSWDEIRSQGYVGWRRDHGDAQLKAEVAFFTDDPVDKQAWFRNRGREVIIAVTVPASMLRPLSEFMQLISTAAGDTDGGQNILDMVPAPEHVWATPRTVSKRYWRYAQAVNGRVLWLPVPA
jgi:hypothetical protein